MMRRIEPADAGFLMLERTETPMHVGGLTLYTFPEGVDEQTFLAELVSAFKNPCEYRKPFGEYVRSTGFGLMQKMYWEEDKAMDLDYHVRRSALPSHAGQKELFELVSRQQSIVLDRTRPLWEAHIIEGLPDRQFAIYIKIHHAVIDGASAMELAQSMCSEDSAERIQESPLSLASFERYKQAKYADRPERVKPTKLELSNVAEFIKSQFDTSINVFGALAKFYAATFGLSGDLVAPWQNVPRTSLNEKLSPARIFVGQDWDLGRVKAVAKGIDGTINDVVLAMCAGALRRYLLEENELPKASLKAVTPVSLREKDDLDSTNAVGFLLADLGTNISDPQQRVVAIQKSMRAGKKLLKGLSTREVNLFMQIAQAPNLLTTVLGVANKFPPCSTIISNVPGPKKPLYFNGASLDGIYPANLLLDGYALTFTLVSYNDHLDFGVVACRRALPHAHRLIGYLEESLQELEDMLGIKPISSKAKTKVKTKAKSKTVAKPKAKKPKAAPKPKKAAAKKPAAKAKLKAN